MAVFPDRIVLKNSSDSDTTIRTAIAVGGTDEIQPGEVVLGLDTGNVRLYTRDSSNQIVAFGGSNSTNSGELSDVDLSAPPTDNQLLIYNAATSKWTPGDAQDIALTEIVQDLTPQLGGALECDLGFVHSEGTSVIKGVDFGFRGQFLELGLDSTDPSANQRLNLNYAGSIGQTLTFPSDQGGSGFALVTDGAGQLSWSSGVAADISLSNFEQLGNVSQTLAGFTAGYTIANPDAATYTTGYFQPITPGTGNEAAGFYMEVDGTVKLNNGNGDRVEFYDTGTFRVSRTNFGLVLDDTRFGYDSTRPSRASLSAGDNQFATFGDLDDTVANLSIDDLGDVDLSVAPVDGYALMWDAASSSWVAGVNPGMGTVTSILIEGQNGISVTDGGPIQVTGSVMLELEPVASVSAGSYSAPNLTVDQYGRITSITSGGNGAGTVTSINGYSGDVSLSILDLNDVGPIPSGAATTTPDVEGTWTIQQTGSNTPNGNGTWKAQVDTVSATNSFIELFNSDGTPSDKSSALSTLKTTFDSGTALYFQVTKDGFTFEPVQIIGFEIFTSSFRVNFQNTSLNVFLFNGGDAATAASNTVAAQIDFDFGIQSAFDFGATSLVNGEILAWNQSESEFRPQTNSLDNLSNTDFTINPPVSGQALIYQAGTWVAGDVNTESHVKEYTFSAPSSSAFRISGPGLDPLEDNPTFYVQRGETVKLTHNAGANSHPVNITDESGTNFTEEFSSALPLTSAIGSITWTVPQDAPNVLKYVCTSHPSMTGEIRVGGGGGSLDLLSDVSYQNGSLEPVDLDQIVFSSTDVAAGVLSKIFASATYGTSLGHLEGTGFPGAAVFAHNTRGIGLSHAGNLIHLQGDLQGTTNQPELRWQSGNYALSTGNYIGLKLPSGLNVDQTYTLPVADGTSGQVLSTDGNGALSWATSSGGGSSVDLSTESIDALQDVDTTTDPPSDGEALVWNATDGEWQPGTISVVGSIDDLSDVDTTSSAPTAGQALVWDGSQWEPGTVASSGGAGAAGVTRQSLSGTASSGTLDIAGVGAWSQLVSIASDLEAWVTLYPTAADRTADASRSFATDPVAGSGVLAEFVISAGLTVLATPGTTLFNNDTSAGETIYAAVRNTSGVAVDAEVTLTVYGLQMVTSVAGNYVKTATTANIAANATTGLVLYNAGQSGMIQTVETDESAWVVLYDSEAARTADSSRTITQPPTRDAGIIAEFVDTDGGDVHTITPASAYVLQAGDGVIYAKVQNLSASPAQITITARGTAFTTSTVSSSGIDGGTFGSG